ncbi:MAG: IS3 family transposase [bacterium]
MRRPRRNHSPVFEAKVALAALEGTETLTVLAQRFDVHAHQIAQWRRQLVARAAEVFATAEDRRAATPVDLKALHAKIGQQALELDFLSSALGAASRLERKAMIDRTHPLAVAGQARLLGLSRASIYYAPRPVSAIDLGLMRRLDELHLELPFAGSRMLRDLLRGEGFVTGRDHVRTLMRRMGIAAVYRRPRTSRRHRAHPVFPYLLRTLTIERPNHVWAADITYIPMARGFVFLVAVMDWAARKVLTWRVSPTLTSDFCVAALEEALARFGRPEIFNTDQGAQFTSADFLGVLRGHQIQISMDGQGCWRDNVFIERLWRSVKYEEVYLHAYESVSDVRAGLRRYFTFFNARRPHDALCRRTPDAVYFATQPHEAAASPSGTPLIPAA